MNSASLRTLNKQTHNKKAQSFFWDFIIGLFIFTLIILLFLRYNTSFESKEDSTENLLREAKTLSESLMTQGYPYNWTTGDVEQVGIISSDENNKGRIDANKLAAFANMSYEDYDNVRFLLGISHDFIVFFEDKNKDIIPISLGDGTIAATGKPNINSTNIKQEENIKTLVKVERHVIYNSQITSMTVYVWSGR